MAFKLSIAIALLLAFAACAQAEDSITMKCAPGECAHAVDLYIKYKFSRSRPFVDLEVTVGNTRRSCGSAKYRVWDSGTGTSCRVYGDDGQYVYYGNCQAYCARARTGVAPSSYKSTAFCVNPGRVSSIWHRIVTAAGSISIPKVGISFPSEALLKDRCQKVGYKVPIGRTSTGILIKTY